MCDFASSTIHHPPFGLPTLELELCRLLRGVCSPARVEVSGRPDRDLGPLTDKAPLPPPPIRLLKEVADLTCMCPGMVGA